MHRKDLENCIVLIPKDDLVGDKVDELNEYLDKILKKLDINKFIINMSKVDQIDSYALSIIATFGNELKNRGGSLLFCNLQPFILSIFKMMRMDSIFTIKLEETDAIEEFNH